MRLKKILKGVCVRKLYNYKNYNIKSVTHISDDVIKSSMFICIKGNNFDGNDYIESVKKLGAKCVVTDSNIECDDIAIVVVRDVRKAMSVIAKNFYNCACDGMDIVGVIGTSGKTTTSHILSQIIHKSNKKIGVIGTNGIFIDGIKLDNKFTTPDPLELHYVFYQMKMLGVKIVVMEISAQAIYYDKLYGVKLKIGVFTNISKEHLDFFNSMEEYVKCKMNYFNKNNMEECVINIDDFYGRELAYKLNIPCVSYGIKNPANSFAIDIRTTLAGLKFTANVMDLIISVNNKLIGDYNVYNILAALTVAKMLGLSDDDIESSINNLEFIDGRFNVFEYGKRKIIVDFAHTPESIEKLLSNVRKIFTGKVVSLFGCVGYSDKDKRIDMAKAVDKYSDFIVITTDNRGVTPFKEIADDIILGISKNKYVCIEDRKCAINFGFGLIKDDEVLVLIGKGAENFQMIEKERCEYNELQYVKELISGGV